MRPSSAALLLGELRLVIGELGANAVDDFRGRFAEEDIVGELALGVGDVLFELLAFLLLAHGGLRLFFGMSRTRSNSTVERIASAFGRGLGFHLESHAGDLLDGFGVALRDGERSAVRQ